MVLLELTLNNIVEITYAFVVNLYLRRVQAPRPPAGPTRGTDSPASEGGPDLHGESPPPPAASGGSTWQLSEVELTDDYFEVSPCCQRLPMPCACVSPP